MTQGGKNINIAFALVYKGNWQDGQHYSHRKNAFLQALIENMNEFGVDYTLPIQQVKLHNKEVII